MGRVSKAKIDEMKHLNQEGYLKSEIAEKVGVSRGTVAKYIGKEVEEGPPSPSSPTLEALVKAFYELLVDLNCSAYLEKEALAELADDQALKLTKRLISVDGNFAKRLLDDNPYVRYLELVNVLKLSVPDDKLDKDELKLRKEWVQLLKQHYPEKLAELV